MPACSGEASTTRKDGSSALGCVKVGVSNGGVRVVFFGLRCFLRVSPLGMGVSFGRLWESLVVRALGIGFIGRSPRTNVGVANM